MTEDDALPAATLAGMAWQAWAAADTAAAQIVQLTVEGDTNRASGLIAEHLAEFPGDQLISGIQAWMSGRRSGR